MLKQAVVKDKAKRILWIRGDSQRLPFQDNTFECVYMTAVIHHIENKEMALREIHRALNKGGNFVIMTFSHSAIRKHITLDFLGIVAMDLKRIPSVPSLKKMMRLIGFSNIHHHAIQIDEGYMPTDKYLKRVRIKKKYGSRIRKISRFVFITCKK